MFTRTAFDSRAPDFPALVYIIVKHLAMAANEGHFCDCCRNMGLFRCGEERENVFVNVHLHCTASNLKRIRKMSTLPFPGKISADAHGPGQPVAREMHAALSPVSCSSYVNTAFYSCMSRKTLYQLFTMKVGLQLTHALRGTGSVLGCLCKHIHTCASTYTRERIYE